VGGDFRLTYPASGAGTVTSTVDAAMVSDARVFPIIDAKGRCSETSAGDGDADADV
jgi:hypothetical protein